MHQNVVNALLQQSLLDRYQFRHILPYPSVSVLQDTTQSSTIPFNNIYTRYDSISILRYYLTRYNSIPLVNTCNQSGVLFRLTFIYRFTDNVYCISRCVQVYKYRICYCIYYKDTIITKFSQSWHF